MNTPDPADRPGVYTPDEAAAILKVSADWLKRRAAARKIPFTMLGGSYRFSGEHLKEIVRLHEQLPGNRGDQSARSRRIPRSARRQAATGEVAQLRPRPASARRKNPPAA